MMITYDTAAKPKKKKKTVSSTYTCTVCKTCYKTEKEAEGCARRISDHFKVGDIVHFGCRVWRIKSFRDGFVLERVPEYLKAFGYHGIRDYQQPKARYLKTYFCSNDSLAPFDLEEAKKRLAERAKQLDAAKSFVEMVKQTSSVPEKAKARASRKKST